ncbi:MAG TPA: DUF4404 family protein [Anaerolineales bacterium]|jgi:predicted  nucleic acid-binding Zn-ribbon protein|nr:DUF4404 family protein [Anaerolineales bacterium]
MTDQNLHDLLKNLENEIQRIDVKDEAGRERLRHLEADIRSLRERSSGHEDLDDSMLERFQDSIDHFETSYPEFTLMVSQMMRILSNAGI